MSCPGRYLFPGADEEYCSKAEMGVLRFTIEEKIPLHLVAGLRGLWVGTV